MESDTTDEQERMVREMAFLYKRFTIDEARAVFIHMEWDKERAFEFVMKSEPQEIRIITGQSEDIIAALQTDASIIDALQNGIKSDTRQFACESCDHMWWRKVPIRKQVSKCNKCKRKYDPVPKEYEWGWAIYKCDCGNEFGSAGQKNTTAPCYKCKMSVYPSEIKPFWKQKSRKNRRNQHCCNAPDCTSHGPVLIHDVDPDRVYDDGTSNEGSERVLYHRVQTTCVSRMSRQRKKKVIYPSNPHISTGSTVGTFLSQSDDGCSYMPYLESIPEHY